jgi:DNA-binding MurR/RpiR family transcriptional regulator
MTATSANQSLADRVAERLPALSPSEVRVASFILEHAGDVAFLSVNDVAKLLGSSDATVVRTAQALGYGGFPDLRRELIETVRNRATPALRLGRGLESVGGSSGSLLENSLDAQIDLLQQARHTVRPEAFDQAVDIIVDASRTLTFGVEAAGHLAQMFALRLRRIGYEAMSISASGLGLADRLLTMRTGDALVAIADEQAPAETALVFAEAKSREVPVIMLTEALPARFANQTTVALIAPRSRAGGFKTLTTTGVLLDTLLLGIAARDRGRALLNLERFDSLRSQLTRRRGSAGSRSTEAPSWLNATAPPATPPV